MPYEERFTDAELDTVIEQGMIYMCACPAQVADGLRKLRSLYRYQLRCLENPQNDRLVHTTIAASVIEAHETLQRCLDEVIVLEKWDRATLEMPPDLRQRQMQELLSDD
ncbi:MAG: hypothetical protein CFE43_02865 [Burkholderiales bacterium PBB3]|nr:MAG: hypothetical protein CFE43_02865 [Burkholderiales bacterium PBB3]